jgi:ketosteroid isomerase-like protein
MLFAACVVVPAQRLASDDPAARIIQTEHEIAAAIVARDIAALDHMHAADFTYIEGTGRVLNKAETLRSYDSTRFRQLTYDDLNVRVYGDTAVVTGRGRAVIERDGSAVEILARISRVHVRRGNKWEVVLYQVTRMAPD